MIRAIRFLRRKHLDNKGTRELCVKRRRHAHYALTFPFGYRCSWCNKWGPVRGDY